ncbi:DUF2062 domain-containing protein [Tianweitania sediminis]|uniref:DUF2062 domain-containing protein n=2 Tax=Tianweitania sediminis TaxID=1502156 RepID=A0A8J7UHS5_9HYPH|nr:DUF2062 domain-containing protein [Tianweitania sediminis]
MTASPHQVAAGAAAGAAVSMFPLIGFHFIFGFVLAFLTRGSMLAAALGTAVGNPLTFPFIFSAAYRMGRWLTPGSDLAAEDMMRGNEIEDIMGALVSESIWAIWPVWKTMMIGAIPLALVVYVASYSFVRWFVSRSHKRRSRLRQRRSPFPPDRVAGS